MHVGPEPVDAEKAIDRADIEELIAILRDALLLCGRSRRTWSAVMPRVLRSPRRTTSFAAWLMRSALQTSKARSLSPRYAA
jgi:hypothetical protein